MTEKEIEIPARNTDLVCRVRLELLRPNGEKPVDLSVEIQMPDAGANHEMGRLVSRVSRNLKERLAPMLMKQLRRWANENVPVSRDNFEEEFSRRCDANDDVIRHLEWRHPSSDVHEEWLERVVDLVHAEQINHEVR